MRIFTLGFTKKSAEEFFTTLKRAGLTRVVDTRLNNVSQLAGFTKRNDLRYFLKEIVGVEYLHMPLLAPTKEILDAYKKGGGNWSAYELKFNELISRRRIESALPRELLDGACLLCSELEPHHCHRRLVAEHLQRNWRDVEIVHL